MLNFKVKQQEYKTNDLVIVMHKGATNKVFKIRKIDSIAQVAETQPYRGKIRDSVVFGNGAMQNKINIPLSAIIRKATQAEIEKAERENKTR